MLLGQHRAHQTLRRLSVGEDAHHVPYRGRLCEGGSPGSAVSFRVVGPKLLPVGHCEGREGQDVRRGVRQQPGHLGERLPELFHHSVQLDVDLCGRRVFFADQLATDGIVERQQPFRAQNGPETVASEGSVIDTLAEGVGFEPTNPCGLTVFKTVAFVHSAIPPRRVARCNQRSRQRLPTHLF